MRTALSPASFFPNQRSSSLLFRQVQLLPRHPLPSRVHLLLQPRFFSGQTRPPSPGPPLPLRAITLSIKVALGARPMCPHVLLQSVLASVPFAVQQRSELARSRTLTHSSHYDIALHYYITTSSLYPPIPPPCPSVVVISSTSTSPSHHVNDRHHHHPATPSSVPSSQGHRASHARRERAQAP
ncbi:hypothetical protein L227DRAFT_437478 [Lentinus tigrinus ALCF2SS1-6]|uniref:Uncharacterized protein n=1 Tax=Lentinus tigrinus ALCF2SS1-6 TaxID=1328759 RepID=A0A5C2SGC4_9APHY|nr:hypothetical protein L227DRAFT_437478 [Lentinus tigrinus ALCF2SS1-6]